MKIKYRKAVLIISHTKKYILIIFILLLLSIFSIIYKSTVIFPIDNPIVSCLNIEIPTTKTMFLYKDIFKRKHNFDTNVANVLKNIKSVSLPPNKELKFNFKQKPLNYTIVKLLENGNYEKVFDTDKVGEEAYYITTPSRKGTYIYSISAAYTDGTGIYYFSITINSQ